MKKKAWFLVGLLIGVLFIVESVMAHKLFTTRFAGGGDFYPSWAAARALLLEGRDPYSPDVSAEIKAAMIGPNQEETISYSFAYPLPVIFLFWPLVYCSYDWVQAIWMVTLQWVAVVIVIGLLCLERWHPPPVGLIGSLLGMLFLYPITRSIFLGQFTLHITLFLVIALWAMRCGRDGLAGVLLALTFIKPQMVVFVVPWLVLWVVRQRRWRLIGGLLAGGAGLLLAAMALSPRWPISFLEGVQRYRSIDGVYDPLAVLMNLVWLGGPEAMRYVLAGLLLLAMLVIWWWDWWDGEESFLRATHWAIVMSLLIIPQTGTTNQAILLIPLFAWLHRALKQWRHWQVLIGASGLLAGLWVLFLSTIQGNWENPVMFLPLPLFSLTALVGIEVHRWWVARRTSGAFSCKGQ
jgi:hypothetical protein